VPNIVVKKQLKIAFDVDDRVEELAHDLVAELSSSCSDLKDGLSGQVHKVLPEGEDVLVMVARMASAAYRKFARHEEPAEIIRCHQCDVDTRHDERVRVVVCVRCALAGGSPGSDG
jgi:primosomal protein N'